MPYLAPQLALRLMSIMRALPSGNPPPVVVVEQKAVGGARLILTPVGLGPSSDFAPFDDSITVTVTHSDIDVSSSPRLEHYPLTFWGAYGGQV